jgi:hypothetical protein
MIRRTIRVSQQSTRLRDFITYKVKKVKYFIQNFLFYNQISPQYIFFLIAISKEQEHIHYLEAIKYPK